MQSNNDLLIYNKSYHIWRDGHYLGTAVWTDDPHNGDCFINTITENGREIKEVYVADRWAFE